VDVQGDLSTTLQEPGVPHQRGSLARVHQLSAIGPYDAGWKDTIDRSDGQTANILFRFSGSSRMLKKSRVTLPGSAWRRPTTADQSLGVSVARPAKDFFSSLIENIMFSIGTTWRAKI
jgi:hypothetical protein